MTDFNILTADLPILHKVLGLVADDHLFLSKRTENGVVGIYPCILCSDMFAPAADVVKLEQEDLDVFIEAVEKYDYEGRIAFCAVKEGATLWRRKGEPWESKFDLAVVDLQKLFKDAGLEIKPRK